MSTRVIPVVPAPAVEIPKVRKAPGLTVYLDARKQAVHVLLGQRPLDTNGVFAVNSRRGMHQTVRQRAVVGQQQEAARVDVEPPHAEASVPRGCGAGRRTPSLGPRGPGGCIMTPSRLFMTSTRGSCVARRTSRRPSTSMRSVSSTRSPVFAGWPLTRMRPAAIHFSIWRRDPRPCVASTFCSFSDTCPPFAADPATAWA